MKLMDSYYLAEQCQLFKNDFNFWDTLGTSYEQVLNDRSFNGGIRVGFKFFNIQGDTRKNETLSKKDFYQVFQELFSFVNRRRDLQTTAEIKINKNYVIVDVAITNRLPESSTEKD